MASGKSDRETLQYNILSLISCDNWTLPLFFKWKCFKGKKREGKGEGEGERKGKGEGEGAGEEEGEEIKKDSKLYNIMDITDQSQIYYGTAYFQLF